MTTTYRPCSFRLPSGYACGRAGDGSNLCPLHRVTKPFRAATSMTTSRAPARKVYGASHMSDDLDDAVLRESKVSALMAMDIPEEVAIAAVTANPDLSGDELLSAVWQSLENPLKRARPEFGAGAGAGYGSGSGFASDPWDVDMERHADPDRVPGMRLPEHTGAGGEFGRPLERLAQNPRYAGRRDMLEWALFLTKDADATASVVDAFKQLEDMHLYSQHAIASVLEFIVMNSIATRAGIVPAARALLQQGQQLKGRPLGGRRRARTQW